MFKRGDKIRIKPGTKVYGVFPKSIAEGYDGNRPFKIYRRSTTVEVRDFYPEHKIHETQYPASIVFAGPSGYWAEVNPNEVEKITEKND